MTTYTDLEKEALAEVAKHDQRKVNTLGPEGLVDEEPFGRTEIIYRGDVWARTPTAETFFSYPEYKDLTGDGYDGYVATRYTQVRLLPLVTSGKDGNDSIQSFATIFRTPDSDSPEEIEAARIKRLVPPDCSLGRTNAAEPDVVRRGFELALYPAKIVGGKLVADSAKQIPTTADPGATYGVGGAGRWTVDYANGIVRLTVAPLNGPTGLFNPNDVYGDLSGNAIGESVGGRITLFATFYRYTGPTLSANAEDNVVEMITVGDGYTSFGTYYGTDATGAHSPIMQQAIDSLGTAGGTIFLKEGTYKYAGTVNVPANVRIVGLSKNAVVVRHSTASAFAIRGSRSSITGIQIRASGMISGFDIELQTNFSSTSVIGGQYVIEDIEISNNLLTANSSSNSQAITFNAYDSAYSTALFRNIKITDNKFFSEPGAVSPTYIMASRSGSNTVSLYHIDIANNDFMDASGTAITLGSPIVTSIEELHLEENHTSAASMAITLTPATAVNKLVCSNNSGFDIVTIDGLTESAITGCRFDTLITQSYGILKSKIVDNIIQTLTMGGAATHSNISDNYLESWSIASISSSLLTNNTVTNTIAVSSAMTDVVFSSNRVIGTIAFNGALTDCSILGNAIDSSMILSNTVTRANISNNISGSYLTAQDGGGATDIIDFIVTNNTFTAASITTTGSKNKITFIGNRLMSGSLIISGGSATATAFKISENTINTDIQISGTPFDSATSAFILAHNIVGGQIIVGQAITNGTVSNNSCNGILTLSGNLIECLINENNCVGVVTFSGTVNSSNINSNIFSGATTFASAIATGGSVAILGNSFGDDLVFSNTMGGAGAPNYTVDISDNILTSDILIGSTGFNITNVKLNNNSCANLTINNTGTKTNINIVDNRITSAFLVDTNTLTSSTIAGNIVGGTADIPALTRVLITNNDFGDVLHINGIVADSSVSGNRAYGPCVLYNPAQRCRIMENLFLGTSASNGLYFIDTADDLTLSGNQFASNKALYFTLAVQNAVITDNKFEDGTADITFANNASNIVLTGNVSESQITITGAATNVIVNDNAFINIILSGILTRCNLIGNSLSAITLSGVVSSVYSNINSNTLSGALTVLNTSLTGCNIQDNTIGGILDVRANLTKSEINNNIVLSTSPSTISGAIVSCGISGNIFGHTSGILTIGGAVSDSSIIGNTVSGTGGTIEFGGNLANCRLTSNEFKGATTIAGTVATSTVGGNRFGDLLWFVGNVTGTEISANKVDGYLSIIGAGLTDVLFDSNTIGAALNLGSAVQSARVTASGNSVSGATTLGSFTNSAFGHNTLIGATTLGAILDTAFNSNTISSTLSLTTATNCSIASNIVDSDTLIVSVSGTKINSNKFNGYFSLLNTGVDLAGSTFVGNTVGGYLILGSTTVSNSVAIGDNTVVGTSAIGRLTNSTCVGNILAASVTFDDLTDTIINSNSFSSSLTFGAASYGSISNNIINGLVYYSSSVVGTEIGMNRIDGYLSLTGASTDLAGTVLTGNSIGGGLFLGSSTASNRITIGNNTVVGATTLGKFTNSTFAGNSFIAATTISDIVETLIDSNSFNNTLDLTTATDCAFVGNTVEGAVTISGLVTGTGLNSNKLKNNFSLAVSSLNDVVMSGNSIAGTFGLGSSTASTQLAVTGNSITGTATLGKFTNSAFTGNIFVAATTISDLIETTVGNNSFNNSLGFTTATDCSISDNIVELAVSFSGLVTGTTVNDNRMKNNFSLSAVAAHADDVINSNSVGGTFAVGSSTVSNRMAVGQNTITGASALGKFTNSAFGDNVFNAAITISDLVDTTFGSNNFGGTVAFTAATGCALTGNTLEGNFSFSGAVSATEISANTFDSGFSIAAAATAHSDLVIANNTVASSFALGSSTASDRITMTGNAIVGVTTSTLGAFNNSAFVGNTFTIPVVFDNILETTVNGNSFNGTLGFATITNCAVVGNTIEGNVALTGASGAEISSNIFKADLDLTVSSMADVELIGNKVGGLFKVGSSTASDRITMTGNTVTGTATVGKLNNSTFTGNTMVAATAFGDLIECTIGNNSFNSTLGFAVATNSAITGNTIESAVTLSGALSGTIYNGNVCKNTFSASSALQYCSITSNTVASTATFSSTIANSTINNNAVNGAMTFNSTIDYGAINGNELGSTAAFNGDLTSVSITGNTFVGDVDFATTTGGTIISSNIMSGATNGAHFNGAFADATFSDNVLVSGKLMIDSSLTRCIIADNEIGSDLTFNGTAANTIVDSEISGNIIQGNVNLPSGTSADIVIATSSFLRNHIVGAKNIVSAAGDYIYNKFNISDNMVGQDAYFACSMSNSVICSNNFARHFNAAAAYVAPNYTFQNTEITSNRIGGHCEIIYGGPGSGSAALYDCVVTNNAIEGTTTIATTDTQSDKMAQKTTFSGNKFTGDVLFCTVAQVYVSIEDCSIASNYFGGDFSILNNNTGASGPFRNISFNTNICNGAALINSKWDSASAIFTDATFNGNVFNSTMTFGDSSGTYAHHFENIIFQGNSGNGGLYFYTDSGPNTAFTGTLIIGNRMASFTVSPSGHTEVPGAADPMMALNRFNASYTGMTLGAEHMEWGGGANGVNK